MVRDGGSGYSAAMMWIGRLLSALLFLGFGGPTELSAASVRSRDFPELVAVAEQIVVGTVLRVRETDEERGTGRRTLVTLGDLEVWKGEVRGAEFVLDLAGGGGARIAHLPEFVEGERVITFVAGNGQAVCPLVGIGKGRFRVLPSPGGDGEFVATEEGRTVTERVGSRLRTAAPGADRGLSMGDFRRLVADELASPTVDAVER